MFPALHGPDFVRAATVLEDAKVPHSDASDAMVRHSISRDSPELRRLQSRDQGEGPAACVWGVAGCGARTQEEGCGFVAQK